MKYLAAFRYAVNAILRGVDIMLTVNINGKKASLWGTLAQMAIAGVASYGKEQADANPGVEVQQ